MRREDGAGDGGVGREVDLGEDREGDPQVDREGDRREDREHCLKRRLKFQLHAEFTDIPCRFFPENL